MRIIMESVRSMIQEDKGVSPRLWAEVVSTAVFILNRTSTSTEKSKTPFELWYGKPAEFEHFRVFGTEVFHIPKQQRRKLDQKSKKCIFIGYNVKGFRVLDERNRIETVRDVKFMSDEILEMNV